MRKPIETILRPATERDALTIGRVCVLAGGGAFDFLYGGLIPGKGTEAVLAALCALANTPYTYRRFTVAECEGTAVGAANAIAVPDLIASENAILPALVRELDASRRAVLRLALRRIRLGLRMHGRRPDPDSLILANVAVFPEFMGRGTGTKLVQHVIDRAIDEGYPSVSLVVWGSNDRARALYERLGFEMTDEAPFKPLRHMPYKSRCLMVRDLS